MTDKLKISGEIDWLAVLLYLLLVIFGWLNVFASAYTEDFRSVFDIRQNYGDQLLWILASFILVVVIFAIDHRFYHFFAYLIFGFAVLSLLAVLAVGVEVNNSRSWIRVMGFSLQPSEFVKVATALAIARYLSGFNIRLWTWRSMTIVALLLGIPAGLIILQPDFGTALVFSCFMLVLYRQGMPGWILALTIFVSVLFLMTMLIPPPAVVLILFVMALAGYGFVNRKPWQALYAGLIFLAIYLSIRFLSPYSPWKPDAYLTTLAAVALSSVVYLVVSFAAKIRYVLITLLLLGAFIGFTFTVDYTFNHILKPHQQTRVNILLGKETDIRDVGYNLNQSKIAIGSGGFLGKGYLRGTQTKLDFVPEQSTDFIFCTVGEEWGFLGTTLVVLLFAGLLVRLLHIAERQRSQFARIYGYGVISILFFHFAVNIGMSIGLFPVIGIPLPFFSYGGSSMMAFTTLLFILLRLDSVRKI